MTSLHIVWLGSMIQPQHGNILSIIGPLSAESTSDQWIPHWWQRGILHTKIKLYRAHTYGFKHNIPYIVRLEAQRGHDDVIKWKYFPRYWPFVRGIHRPPVNSPHKGQWRGALMFTLICARINGWVNNCEAGDLRRNRAHYDVIVMATSVSQCTDVVEGMRSHNARYIMLRPFLTWTTLWRYNDHGVTKSTHTMNAKMCKWDIFWFCWLCVDGFQFNQSFFKYKFRSVVLKMTCWINASYG